MDDARTVEHVMERAFRAVDEAAEFEPFRGVTVVARKGRPLRVIHSFGTVGETSDKPTDRGETFLNLGLGTPLLDAMREMRLAGASCALVYCRPNTDRVNDLAGVLTLRELSVYRTRLADLF